MINYSLSIRNRYVTVDGTKTKKAFAYAKAKDRDVITCSDFLHEIASNSKYGAGMFATILCDIAAQVVANCKSGLISDCGSMGHFGSAVSSEGVYDIADFTAANIKKAYVKWTKPSSLASLAGAQFCQVSTNSEAAAIKNAVKNSSSTATMPSSTARTLMRAQQAAIDAAN